MGLQSGMLKPQSLGGRKGMGNHWEKEKQEHFINPYNFIPLEDKVVQKPFQLDYENGITGYFDCDLEILTPVFIPNTSIKTADDECQEFFSYDELPDSGNKIGQPVIPGSEIRGAVRSVFEAAFNGCMSAVSGDRVLGRRCQKPKKAGILEKIEKIWTVTPCERYMLYVDMGDSHTHNEERDGVCVPRERYDGWEEGQCLYFKKGGQYHSKHHGINTHIIQAYEEADENVVCPEGWETGYLHKGEGFIRKHHESVFKKKEGKTLSIDPKTVENLKAVLKEYRDEKKNRNYEKGHNGYKEYDVDKEKILVYYYDNQGIAEYLSPACIGKELYENSVELLLKNNGGYQPCKEENKVCPACALFGMVSENEGKAAAIASRLRFTDAILKKVRKHNSEYYMVPLVLDELLEPKPGTAEFYTYSPYTDKEKPPDSEGYWTYDYYVDGKTRQKLPDGKLKVRGRKYYWHSDQWKKYICRKTKVTKLQQIVRPLKAENQNTFRFRVYFEHVTKQELEQLKWALDFNNKECAHKIGRAKPLGFGSIRICVDKWMVRNINMDTGVWEMQEQDINQLRQPDCVSSGKAVSALKILANWEKRPGTPEFSKYGKKLSVTYPLGEDSTKGKKNSVASHQWFNGNCHISKDSKPLEPKFSMVLPEVTEEVGDEENWLYKLMKK